MIMREYCYKILAFVMVTIMSVSPHTQNAVTEDDSTTILSPKYSEMIMAIHDKDNVKVIKRYNRYRHHPRNISNSPFQVRSVETDSGRRHNEGTTEA